MATPYELRFEMYHTAMDRLKEVYFARQEEKRLGSTEPLLPFPTVADGIKEAKEIMEFVNNDK